MKGYAAKKALEDFSFSLQIDPELAQAWHCCLATMAMDAGAPYKEAHERVSNFMLCAFDVVTTRPPFRTVGTRQ